MASRYQIRDFKRATVRRRANPIVVEDSTEIRPINHNTPQKAQFLDIKRPRSKPKAVQPRLAKSKVLKRQGLKKLPAFTPRKTKRHVIRVMAISGSFLFLFTIALNTFLNIGSDNSPPETTAVMSATDVKPAVPSETEPSTSDLRSYQVANDVPRYFKSKRLGIDARLKEVDIDVAKIEVPDNIFDIGWYKKGGRPGQGKTVLLSGSVSGESKNGVFGRIGSVKVGDALTIEMGDGTVHTYTVKSTKSYPKEQVNNEELLKSVDPSKEGLNLIALANRFDVRSQDFEDNFAVFAVKE